MKALFFYKMDRKGFRDYVVASSLTAGMLLLPSGCATDQRYSSSNTRQKYSSDTKVIRHQVDPHHGREYQAGMKALGTALSVISDKQTPEKEREAVDGLEAMGILMDLLE